MIESTESSNTVFNTSYDLQLRSLHQDSNQVVANWWPNDLLRHENQIFKMVKARSYFARLRATDESVPGPFRDVQTVRHIVC